MPNTANNTATDWLRADARGRPIGVDREAGPAGILYGYIVAQEGSFKTGRGEFDLAGLKTIQQLMRTAPNGTKSRFAHPSLSGDGIGSFLGRAKNPRIEKISERDSQGELKTNEIHVVRADLHFDPTSRETPSGDLGGYVMSLAESDPDALSSSMVLQYEPEYRIDKSGLPLVDEETGEALPPLWRPIRIHASDLVDTGDAVDGVLSAQLDAATLPDAAVRQGAALLDRQFAGKDSQFIRSHCTAWLDRYLELRFGDEALPQDEDAPERYNPQNDPELRRRRRRK